VKGLKNQESLALPVFAFKSIFLRLNHPADVAMRQLAR